MATLNQSLVPQMTGDTEFRAAVQFVHDAMVAAGFVHTAQTGEIANIAALSRPGAINTVAGFRMYRSNDGLTDYYVKIEFGTGSNVQFFAMWITAGWAIDGAGAFVTSSYNASTRKAGFSPNAPGTTSRQCYASGRQDATYRGQIVILLFATPSSVISHFIVIERTRNPDATIRSDEIWLAHWTGSTANSYNQVLPRTGTLPAQSANNLHQVIPNVTSNDDQYAGNQGVGLLFPVKGGLLPPCSQAWAVTSTRFTAGQTENNMETYGEGHTFLYAEGANIDPGNGKGVMIRYD